jgi:glycosyltransferase involved in cell wall biosynthesis
MKILQLCNKSPYPPMDGGAIAMLSVSKSLALEGHPVAVLSMNTGKHHVSPVRIPSELTSLIGFHFIRVNTAIRPLSLLINFFFSKLPYHAIRFKSVAFRKALEKLLESNSFDIIQLESLYLKQYIPVIRKYHKGPVSYRAHNIESQIWERLATQLRNPLKKFYLKNLSKRIAKYEKSFINRYDLLVPITREDGQVFQSMGNTKPLQVVATGIMPEGFREVKASKSGNSIFFIGALDWIPNREGLLWFIDNVWDRLRTDVPISGFHIAGRNAPVWFEEKCHEHGITFHGEVPDAYTFMDTYDIMIVPLFAGSGLRIKIAEAMARSKVVVTTSIGAQGLSAENNKHILIADDADTFRLAVAKLLTGDTQYTDIRKNAFAFAYENFNNSSIIKELLQFYSRNQAC